MLVVDASVLVTALSDDVEDGAAARGRLRGQRLVAPEVVNLQVASVLRRHVLAGALEELRAAQVFDDLRDLALRRVPHRALVRRCWELRSNVKIHDAAYVAEAAGAVLVTGDGRLSRAAGIRCEVEVLGH